MKIYEIGTGYTPIPAQMGAATEIVVEELANAFLELKENVVVVDISSSYREKTNFLIEEIKMPAVFNRLDVSLGLIHKIKRVVYSILLALKIRSLIKKSSEKTILHFHNQYNMFFYLKIIPEKMRKKVLTAYTVHSYIWGTDWDKIEKTIKNRYFQEIECVKNADAVLVLNEITSNHFVEKLGVDSNRIFKIINGVSLKKYRPLPVDTISQFKAEIGFENKKIIFQVGSVCERKNQLGSVEMLAEYLKSHKDVVYIYAGGIIDSDYQNAIIKYASENGIEKQVVYVGELSPGKVLNQYYNIADCSVFTSKLESFGLVIIEAIASGTPVVVGSKPLFDLKNGYTIFNSKDEFIDQIDLCLKKIVHSDYDRTEVLDKYNWTSVAKEHLNVFNSIQERQ